MVDESASPTQRAIYVVSDATADTAERMTRAALIQFRKVRAGVRIFSMVRDPQRAVEVVDLAAEAGAIVVHTIANEAHRAALMARASDRGVPAVDLIGHLMGKLSAFFGETPAGRPGIPRLTDDYFRRIEAVEFTIQHDDGQMVRTLPEADLVLVGLSRTSKTPLATYLAQKGWRVANMPLVLGLPLPRELEQVDPMKVFGLTIDVASLIRIRRVRLRTLNMPMNTNYARRDHILQETEYARSVFEAHPKWPVIDVSLKAIEESAALVLRIMDERDREGQSSASNTADKRSESLST